jgi:hypothetical protein
MTVDNMSFDEMSYVIWTVYKMSFAEMIVDKMSADEITSEKVS